MPKPVKRTRKNVIKNLVKENQRIHDYNSPFGVKYWNEILFQSKSFAKNRKVFDKNLVPTLEKIKAYWLRCLEENPNEQQYYELKQKLWQVDILLSDTKWKELFDENARLKPEARKILWVERCGNDTLKEYYSLKPLKRKLRREEFDLDFTYNEEEF